MVKGNGARLAGILLALSIIFASGVWVGRLIAPRNEAAVQAGDGTATDPGDGLSPQTRRIFERYVQELDLTPGAQQDRVAELIRQAAPRLRGLERNSPERLAELERFHQALDAHLDAAQRAKAAAILRAARERAGSTDAERGSGS